MLVLFETAAGYAIFKVKVARWGSAHVLLRGGFAGETVWRLGGGINGDKPQGEPCKPLAVKDRVL